MKLGIVALAALAFGSMLDGRASLAEQAAMLKIPELSNSEQVTYLEAVSTPAITPEISFNVLRDYHIAQIRSGTNSMYQSQRIDLIYDCKNETVTITSIKGYRERGGMGQLVYVEQKIAEPTSTGSLLGTEAQNYLTKRCKE